MYKRVVKIVIGVLFFVVVGGFAGVVAERFIMPWLSSKESFKRLKFFQKANEQVTIINNTEQITVKEEFSVVKTTQGILPAVVSIVRYEERSEQKDSLLRIKTSQDIQKNVKTGLILTSDGLIVSTYDQPLASTVDPGGAIRYKVLAADGREFDATVKTIDWYSNLIYYKVEATNLSSPLLGNSDELENGEKMILIGNATGEYQNSFSMGMVKEKDKTFTLLNSELSSSEKMEGAIITDAQIDNKNIGGPVLDFNGSVVGIANQVEKDGKKIGFIMPINQIKDSIDRVMKQGELQRPELGLYYLSINREIALLNRLPVNQGALIYSFSGQQGLAVIKDSPADLAGMKLGDIITEVNGNKITLDHSLSEIISRLGKGEEVTMKVLREGEEIEVKAKLS